MAVHEIHIDRSRPLTEQPDVGHNRWHPDITPIAHCRPGDEVVMESRDAVDGQITPGSTIDDVRSLNANVIHPLTGPVFVEGAELGDLLVVDILEVVPGSFGFTLQSPGFGFLRDAFPDPFLVRWHLAGGSATTQDIPGIRIPASPFMGTIGVAPSRELLNSITARERTLADAGGIVDLPEPTDAVPSDERISHEALRTIPPRENAGNVDIKQLTAGARLLLPVWTEGALFSAGDAHFAQGDCEACGQAIEMSATLRARLNIRKGAARERGIAGLRFERHEPPPGPAEGTGDAYVATTGVCVERDGSNRSEDLTLAARNALLDMIDHITSTFGYSKQQAYALCSVAVDLKINQAVDLPNVLISAFLPLGVFEQGVSGR